MLAVVQVSDKLNDRFPTENVFQMIAALNFNYKLHKKNSRALLSVWDTLVFSGKALLHWLGLAPVPTQPDDSTALPMEFTMAEVEYQVDEMLFKMNALAGTANLPEKPPVYFTDSDATYTAGTDEEKMVLAGQGVGLDMGALTVEGQQAILRMYQVWL